MNGDQLTLRPEGTAGVVRAVLEHNLVYDGPKRLWYKGPMFRHERPQRGRYRQFFQFGAEAIGFSGPDIDAELIMLCRRLWDDLGLENIRLELNSIGNADERQRHRADLIAYFEAARRASSTPKPSAACTANPLRILDTKNPAMQEMVNAAPQAARLPGRRIAGPLRRRQAPARPQQGAVHRQPAPGARPGLLQPHRVRVGHRCTRLAGHDLRRRPLRSADRNVRRQGRRRPSVSRWAWSA